MLNAADAVWYIHSDLWTFSVKFLFHFHCLQWFTFSSYISNYNYSTVLSLNARCYLTGVCQGLPRHAVERDGRLMITNVLSSHSGTYTCTAIDLQDVQPASVILTVEDTCKSYCTPFLLHMLYSFLISLSTEFCARFSWKRTWSNWNFNTVVSQLELQRFFTVWTKRKKLQPFVLVEPISHASLQSVR